MSDSSVQGRIEQLVEEERALLDAGEGKGPDPDRDKRLEQVKVELDRCWDLLRQRRALEEFGLDPSGASARPERTVEDYQQ